MDSRSVARWSVVVCATRPFKTDCSESKTKARADSTRGDLAWLVQMGEQRGGLYSYDWLDRLFGFLDHPSATSVLPELQRLAGGDKIRLGPREELVVAALEPARALVLSYNAHGMELGLAAQLHPVGDNRTRLVSHGIERLPRSILSFLGMLVMEPASLIMTQRMLLGLKQRAERTTSAAVRV